MSSKKLLGRKENIGSAKFGGDYNLSLNGDTYFVNLNIVNTNKGIHKTQAENVEENERQRIVDLQKFHSSRANKELSSEYLATTIAQLSRRDKVPGDNNVSGNFTEIKPILNKSISRVLIYGSPGTGKTTLCKKIVEDFYTQDLWNHLDEVIWIPLKQLKDPKFEDEEMNEEKLLKIFLNQENLNINFDNVLFILDGWDEIQDLLSDPKKVKLVETINKIKDGKNLILTSRPYVQLNFADYQRVLEITGFTTKNVRDYIKTVLKENNRLSELEKIMAYISNNLLSDLVTIPIILEIFLYAWQEISAMDKNHITTTKLYETFILKLLKNFLIKSGKDVPENLTLTNVINGPLVKEFKILKEMARKWLENGSLQFMYKDFEKTNEKLEARLPFLNSSSIGADEDWKNERSEFVHLTFLEFFAAFELINRSEEDFRRFISENKFNPKYFVVLTFAAGLIQLDLHNLKGFSQSTNYRYTKEEKLELYFDYLQSDPIDFSGKYIYMLLIDCMYECKLSKSRETSIYQEIASFASHQHYYSGIDGYKILACLRRFPPGLLEEYLKVGGGNFYQLTNFSYKFPQFTDEQVEMIFKRSNESERTKLDILCMQSSFSPYCSDVILKLTTFDSLHSYSSKPLSNLPLEVLEKMLKLVINKELFENQNNSGDFKSITGLSCQDTIELCSRQLVNVEKDDSIQDIILKLILSGVDDEKLFFLEDVHEFIEVMPEILLRILNDDQYDTAIYERALKLITIFDINSQDLVEKLLQILNQDEKLKYQALKSLAYIFHKTEMPKNVAKLLLTNFKSLLAAEKERLNIQNRLVKDYMVSIDREFTIYSFSYDWRINQTTYSMKEFVNCLKGRCDAFACQLLIDMFLGTPVSELPLDLIRKENRQIFKIFPFIVQTKGQDRNLDMKAAITNIIKSKEEVLKEMVDAFDADLLCDTIKEILTGISGKERNDEWKWTMKRILYTFMEMQRNSRNKPKCAPKDGDEKCVYHAHLLNSEELCEIFENEDIQLNKTIESVADSQENLFDTMRYLCYEKEGNSGLLLWKLLYCGVEDSEYQEKLIEHIVKVFSQDLEIEMRCLLLWYLSDRIHRLTKDQLIEILKYEGDEKDYDELNENSSNKDRSYLSSMASSAKSDLLSNHKFIKDCEYFSEDEQLELRKLSASYDKFCREESDLEIEELLEEFSSQINEIMNRAKTKDILNVVVDYMKNPDYNSIDSKLKSIDPEMHAFVLERFSRIANRFFPDSYARQFISAYLILDQDSNPDYTKLIKHAAKLKDKTFSPEIIQKIYEKLDDNVLGAFFLKVLEENYKTKIVPMVKCIHESSSEMQKSYMAYALVQILISLDDNVSVYVFNNDLYMGSSVSDKPALSNLNQNQLQVLLNAKSIANYNGFNIQLCGIAQNIQSYEEIVGKCSVLDLSDKEKLLKNKKCLDLTNQNIKEHKEMEKIFNFIKKYPVETLLLSNNQITGEIFEFIIRNANETHVKHLILHSNSIALDKFDFEKLFADEESYMKRNTTLLLLDISNNPTSIDWLQNFEKLQDAEKFTRKDDDGNILLQGYTVNNANIILYRRSLNQEHTSKCQVM